MKSKGLSIVLFLLLGVLAVTRQSPAQARAGGAPDPSAPLIGCGPAWRIAPGSNLSDFAVLAPNDIWAVNYLHAMAHWNGVTWQKFLLTNPPLSLNSTAAVAPNDVWAVGGDGGAQVIYHWDGASWQLAAGPSVHGSLRQVRATAADDVWAVGAQYNSDAQTLIEHWNGTKWQIVPSPNAAGHDSELHSVAAIAANDAWAVGMYRDANEQQHPLVEHWDGQQWSLATFSDAPGSWQTVLWNISASATDDAWAVGWVYGGTRPGIFHWNGQQWSYINNLDPDLPGNLMWVSARASNDVWVTGAEGYRGGWTILHWDGVRWAFVPNTLVGTFDPITAISPNDVWVGGDQVAHYANPCATTSTPPGSSTGTSR